MEKFGAKPPLVAGPLIVTLGYLLFMIPAASDNYWTSFFPGMAVLGFGMALIVAPLTTTVMNAVPGERAGVASGVNNAVSRIAGLLGIAVLGIVIVQSFNRELDGNLNALKIAPEVRRAVDEQRVRLAGAQLSSVVDQGLRASLEQAIKESFIFGFRMVMLAAAGLALLGAVVAMTAIENRPK